MLVDYPYTRKYLFTALEAAPDLFDHLLKGLTEAEADRRPDPERFTIREIMAHLADWDAVFLARMTRVRDEDEPTIEGYDEGQRAIDLYYDRTDPTEQSRLFRERRVQLVKFLRSLEAADWQRACLRPEIGRLTFEGMALLVPLHDTYHLEQVAAWRKAV
ncbi:MAG: DinB family protein [Abitibacteriaceae bacterium]|nr:DinB family protein [Abditibacteriaceae bacterium]